jgi:hypothetical protein
MKTERTTPMASVDRDTLNGIAKTTDVNAGGHSEEEKFNGEFVFGVDAFPVAAMLSAMREQNIDGAYGRALNTGRGVVGEGGDAGPGVVGIAGNAIANPNKPFSRELSKGPFPGRGWRFGVIGFSADPVDREGRLVAGGVYGRNSYEGDDQPAFGVLGECNASLGSGVCGTSTSGVGVKGFSDSNDGVRGQSSSGVGVQGVSAGESSSGVGVQGVSSNNDGVAGSSKAEGRSGVFGRNTRTNGSGNGVYGASDSPDGTGVWGTGVQGYGVVGKTQGLDRCGVYGENTAVLEEPTPERAGKSHLIEPAPQTLGETRGRGIGVQGVSTHGVGVNGASYNNHGVVGEASRARSGVYGLNLFSGDPHGLDQAERTSYGVTGHADDFYGIGVRGMSKHGYGATLQGGQAPLRLLPAETAGIPSGYHQVGELFVDSHGNLYFCKVAGQTPSSALPAGSPGTSTWVKIA